VDLAGLIKSFSTSRPGQSYSVIRREPGGYQRGVAQPTVDQQITVTGSLQPATGADLLRLPEGRRSNETRVFFTTVQLQISDEGSPFEADIVMINGERWECQHVEQWIHSTADETAYRCILQAPTDGDG